MVIILGHPCVTHNFIAYAGTHIFLFKGCKLLLLFFNLVIFRVLKIIIIFCFSKYFWFTCWSPFVISIWAYLIVVILCNPPLLAENFQLLWIGFKIYCYYSFFSFKKILQIFFPWAGKVCCGDFSSHHNWPFICNCKCVVDPPIQNYLFFK